MKKIRFLELVEGLPCFPFGEEGQGFDKLSQAVSDSVLAFQNDR